MEGSYAALFMHKLPSSLSETTDQFSVFLLIFAVSLAIVLLQYANLYIQYHRQHADGSEQRLPPVYPFLVSYLGSTIPFVFDNARFLRKAGTYAGKLSCSRIRVLGSDLYLFQDRETVSRLWKLPSMSSPIDFYVHVLRHFFGMHERAIRTYQSDSSGPFVKAFTGSNVARRNRIDYLTHEGFKHAFSGPGLTPQTYRFMRNLERKFDDLGYSTDWTYVHDLSDYFRMVHGDALLEVVFGPSLSKINPTFLQDLWEFDDNVAFLARSAPAFLFPKPYQVRTRLHNHFKRWYSHARKNFTEDCVDNDGDGDPYWGSNLIRYQQKMYLQIDNYDDDALAAADLALVWGTLGNAVPATMLSVYHTFKDTSLLKRVRDGLELSFGKTPVSEIEPSQLIQGTLLSSIHAETLRLYINVCVMLSSPHEEIHLGRWSMPKGEVGLVHSGIAHKDECFWNTRGGAHPVDSFWADRFITDPEDPTSGPTLDPRIRQLHMNECRSKGPTFSIKGLEASWMPYGGGNAICPGRLLAKRITLFTIAFMAKKFDIELLDDGIEMGSLKFGMGADKPKKAIPFRIRARVD